MSFERGAQFFFGITFSRQPSDEQKARFYEAEAHAPAGYPTLFVVTFASRQAGNFSSPSNCSMEIETLGVDGTVFDPNNETLRLHYSKFVVLRLNYEITDRQHATIQ